METMQKDLHISN